jgi:hypothetical protein
LAVACGLYFKAQLFASTIEFKNRAFEAPLWWMVVLMGNAVKSFYNKENRKILYLIISKPYGTLLVCFLSLSMISIKEEIIVGGPIRNIKEVGVFSFRKTNKMVMEKLGFNAA